MKIINLIFSGIFNIFTTLIILSFSAAYIAYRIFIVVFIGFWVGIAKIIKRT